MKNLIIIIGTILLGAVIVNSLVLGSDNSLKSAAKSVVNGGVTAIESQAKTFNDFDITKY